MGCNTKVVNVSSNWTYKRNVAIGLVEQCIFDWVEYPFSVRTLSDEETVARRAKKSREGAPLPAAELPNCVFRFRDHEGYLHNEHMTAIAANQFAQLQP